MCVVDVVEHAGIETTFDSIKEQLTFVQIEGLVELSGEEGDVTDVRRGEWRVERGKSGCI